MRLYLFIFVILCLYASKIKAHPGIALVYDKKHTVYFTDLEHVWKVDTRTGTSEIFIRDIHTHELYLDQNGLLYGEHYWYKASEEIFMHYIWRSDSTGNIQIILPEIEGENDRFSFVRNQFAEPIEIIARDGNHDIVHTIGDSTITWHTLELNNPGWRFLTHNNEFVITDYPAVYGATQDSLWLITDRIRDKRFPFSIQSDDHSLYGIWEDRAHNLYIAAYGGRSIFKILPSGHHRRILTTGFLWSPLNGVFDQDENLWLLESNMFGEARVRKILKEDLNGEQSFMTENIIFLLIATFLVGVIVMLLKRKYLLNANTDYK